MAPIPMQTTCWKKRIAREWLIFLLSILLAAAISAAFFGYNSFNYRADEKRVLQENKVSSFEEKRPFDPSLYLAEAKKENGEKLATDEAEAVDRNAEFQKFKEGWAKPEAEDIFFVAFPLVPIFYLISIFLRFTVWSFKTIWARN